MGKKHMYISIRLDCIWWFKWCHIWVCMYSYILRSSVIFVCLYDQVMMSMVFVFDWAMSNLDVSVYLYFQSSGIFVCLYDQILDVNDFHVWLMSCFNVLVYLYSRSSGISVCLYDRDMMSLIFMFGCACILICSEVVEYLYACITRLWGHWFYT
jgi:hypothetical protein